MIRYTVSITSRSTRRPAISDCINIDDINRVNSSINSYLPLEKLLSEILVTAKEILASEGVSILLRDDATGELVFSNTTAGDGFSLIGERVPAGKGIAGRVAQTGDILVENNVLESPDFFSDIDRRTSFKTRNIIALPMIVLDELVGVLEIVNARDREFFSSNDTEKARYIATQAAIAITNRRLIDDLNNRVRELESLYDISQSIVTSDTPAEAEGRIVDSITGTLGFNAAAVLGKKEGEKNFTVEAVSGFDSLHPGLVLSGSDSIAALVYDFSEIIESRGSAPQIIASFTGGEEPLYSESFIIAPILDSSDVLGVLILDGKNDASDFTPLERRMAVMICSFIADLKIKEKNQLRQDEQRMLDREIKIAAKIQLSSLPEIPGEFNGHELAAFYRPAKIVGGDFYDFFSQGDDHYGILIADISGKGVPAAVFMGASRNIIRAERAHLMEPEIMLSNANREICRESESSMFITLFFACISRKERLISYCSAGHNPQLLVRYADDTSETLKGKGRALGLAREGIYERREIGYAPGDILCLFTDGVVESLGGSDLDALKGEQILAKTIVDMKDESLHDIAERLILMHKQTELENRFIDDFTLVLIRLR